MANSDDTPEQMKTAVSLEDELPIRADRTARQMGIRRSRLLSLPLESYLRKRRTKETLAIARAVEQGLRRRSQPGGTANRRGDEAAFPVDDSGKLASLIRQGQVYWIGFGVVAGSAPAERHPCVVVQSDLFNKRAAS